MYNTLYNFNPNSTVYVVKRNIGTIVQGRVAFLRIEVSAQPLYPTPTITITPSHKVTSTPAPTPTITPTTTITGTGPTGVTSPVISQSYIVITNAGELIAADGDVYDTYSHASAGLAAGTYNLPSNLIFTYAFNVGDPCFIVLDNLAIDSGEVVYVEIKIAPNPNTRNRLSSTVSYLVLTSDNGTRVIPAVNMYATNDEAVTAVDAILNPPIPSRTPTHSVTRTHTPTRTASKTPTQTPSNTLTPSLTPSSGVTATPSPTVTKTASATPTATASNTPTHTLGASRSPTATVTQSPTVGASATVTPTLMASASPITDD
jgi:hypothetical protein